MEAAILAGGRQLLRATGVMKAIKSRTEGKTDEI
jgi:hypothetical protein